MRNRIVHGHLLLQLKAALLNPLDVVATLADLAKLYQIWQHQNVIQLWGSGPEIEIENRNRSREFPKSYGKLQLQIKSESPKDRSYALAALAVLTACLRYVRRAACIIKLHIGL